MLATIVLSFVALLALCYALCINKWRNPTCKGSLPPGSMGLPFIGETLQLFIPSDSLDTHRFIKKRIQRYGPIFRTSFGGKPVVISTDSEFNNYMLTQEGKLVEVWYMALFKVLKLKEANITDVGYVHNYLRRVSLSHVGSEVLREKLLPRIEDMVKETLSSWSKQGIVEVKRSTSKAICDFSAKILLGYDAKESPYDLSESFNAFGECLLSIPLNIPGSTFHQCFKKKQKGMDVLMKKIRETRTSVEKKYEEDLLNTLLNDMEKEEFVTEDFIGEILFTLLLASSETISLTIALMFIFLSSHPSALQELMAEQESILQNRQGSNSSIDWNEYKSMTFTHQVINETLRLGSVAPGLLRRAIKDIQYKGYTIPAGWTIMIITSTRHVNSDIYKNPLVFDPSRWKDLDSYTVSKNFTPFGGGTRQCVGAEYTKVVLATFLHVLVTKYRWTTIKEGKVFRRAILGLGDGVHIKLLEKHFGLKD